MVKGFWEIERTRTGKGIEKKLEIKKKKGLGNNNVKQIAKRVIYPILGGYFQKKKIELGIDFKL